MQTFTVLSTEERTVVGGAWVLLSDRRSRTLSISAPNYIKESLLPTFQCQKDWVVTSEGGVVAVDPQFLIDFKRAAPAPNSPDLASKWRLNGERMMRDLPKALSKLQTLYPKGTYKLTQLLNQRCGIDMCRHYQSTLPPNHLALPNNAS